MSLTTWGFVPARGGSKSIPLKNLTLLSGKPLLEYGIRAALQSHYLSKIICSSDNEEILNKAQSFGVERDLRSTSLSGDEAPVSEVVREFLSRQKLLPEIIILIQPTSPFLLVEHINSVVAAFQQNKFINSVHTLTDCPHNYHAWNQRTLDDEGMVFFPKQKERSRAFNKQMKPKYYVFGNLIAARVNSILSGQGFYVQPSFGIHIPRNYSFDLDVEQDIPIANSMIESGQVVLPHMNFSH